jgi:hypothetical protein
VPEIGPFAPRDEVGVCAFFVAIAVVLMVEYRKLAGVETYTRSHGYTQLMALILTTLLKINHHYEIKIQKSIMAAKFPGMGDRRHLCSQKY